MCWGAPQVSFNRFETITPTNRGGFGWTRFGPGVRGAGTATTGALRGWHYERGEPDRGGALRPASLFAAVHIDTTSEQGSFGGINTPTADAGFHIGVGSGTFDSAGNALIVLHGGEAWKNSGVSIGTGSHTVGVTATTSGEEFYIDGLQAATGGPSNLGSGTHFISMAAMSSGATPRSLTSGVVVAMVAVWYRQLTAAEMAVLHEDPYCMLRF